MEAVSFNFACGVLTPRLAFFHFWHRTLSFRANLPLEVCIVNFRHRTVSFVAISQTKVFSFDFWHRAVSFFANLPKEFVHTNFGIEL